MATWVNVGYLGHLQGINCKCKPPGLGLLYRLKGPLEQVLRGFGHQAQKYAGVALPTPFMLGQGFPLRLEASEGHRAALEQPGEFSSPVTANRPHSDFLSHHLDLEPIALARPRAWRTSLGRVSWPLLVRVARGIVFPYSIIQ